MLTKVLYRFPQETQVHYIEGQSEIFDGQHFKKNFVFADFEGKTFQFNKLSSFKSFEMNDENQLKNCCDNFLIKNINHSIQSTTEDEYEKSVKKAIDFISKEVFDKVVLSKIKVKKNYLTQLDLGFISLCRTYPECFVCLFQDENLGTWLGASPEILLQSTPEWIKTVALAGTQQAQGKLPKDAVWTQKEIEEQALVSRYIVNCFKKIRLREFEEKGPKTVQTGKLFHLKTDFLIDKKEANIPCLENSLLNLLHPTSAVCGMPKIAAKEFISVEENHSRNLYTGFWGPTNESHFSLYVNIRLVQIFKNDLCFYAGAGITSDSDPQAEWQETEAKCDNLAIKLAL